MKKKSNLVKNSMLVSIFVVLTKVLGFVKQAVLAWAFGVRTELDLFFAADGFVSMFGQVMSQSIEPSVSIEYIHIKSEKYDEKANRLVDDSFVFFTLLSIFIVIISVIFSKNICNVIGRSYIDGQQLELRKILIIISPLIITFSISSICSGYLNAKEIFVPGKMCGLFLSTSVIISILTLRKQIGVWSLIIGMLIGYIVYTIYVVVLTLKTHHFHITNPLKNSDFHLLLKKFLTLVAGNTAIDLCAFVDRIIASSLAAGSVASLYYAQVISNDLVSSVIVSTIGTVILTEFSKKTLEGNYNNDFIEQVKIMVNAMILIMLLISALYLVLGEDIISLFFERGSFTTQDTKRVYAIVLGYAVGFVFMGVREILIKAHYAFQDTYTPMVNGISGVLINIILTIILSKKLGEVGISLATSISVVFVTIVSAITLRKHVSAEVIDKPLILNIVKIIFAICVSLKLGLMMKTHLTSVFILIRMIIIALVMILTYVVNIVVLKENTITQLLKRK